MGFKISKLFKMFRRAKATEEKVGYCVTNITDLGKLARRFNTDDRTKYYIYFGSNRSVMMVDFSNRRFKHFGEDKISQEIKDKFLFIRREAVSKFANRDIKEISIRHFKIIESAMMSGDHFIFVEI